MLFIQHSNYQLEFLLKFLSATSEFLCPHDKSDAFRGGRQELVSARYECVWRKRLWAPLTYSCSPCKPPTCRKLNKSRQHNRFFFCFVFFSFFPFLVLFYTIILKTEFSKHFSFLPPRLFCILFGLLGKLLTDLKSILKQWAPLV